MLLLISNLANDYAVASIVTDLVKRIAISCFDSAAVRLVSPHISLTASKVNPSEAIHSNLLYVNK